MKGLAGAASVALVMLVTVPVGLAGQGEQEKPRLRPTRDVDVTYSATQADARLVQRVRWLASAQTMRIDPPTRGLYVIIDHVARRTSVVREANRSVIDMAAPKDMTQLGGNSGSGAYIRRGEDTVAGVGCTLWETMDRDGRRTVVCITADGVLLRATAAGKTLVTATAIQYAPQDPAAFHVPAGYTHRAAGDAR
jgi:hypothetical protein